MDRFKTLVNMKEGGQIQQSGRIGVCRFFWQQNCLVGVGVDVVVDVVVGVVVVVIGAVVALKNLLLLLIM